MMRLPRFRYLAPRTIRDAVRARADAGERGAFVAGGTDLYPNMKRRQATPEVVVGLSRISALARLRAADGGVSIGAGVILSDVASDPRMRRDYPALVHAVLEISTPPLRNVATL